MRPYLAAIVLVTGKNRDRSTRSGHDTISCARTAFGERTFSVALSESEFGHTRLHASLQRNWTELRWEPCAELSSCSYARNAYGLCLRVSTARTSSYEVAMGRPFRL